MNVETASDHELRQQWDNAHQSYKICLRKAESENEPNPWEYAAKARYHGERRDRIKDEINRRKQLQNANSEWNINKGLRIIRRINDAAIYHHNVSRMVDVTSKRAEIEGNIARALSSLENEVISIIQE